MKIYALTFLRATCTKVAEKYRSEGFEVVCIHSALPPVKRLAAIRGFNEHAGDKVALVATIDAMLAPINVGPVDHIHVVEEHPDPAATLQAKNRAHYPVKPNETENN